MKLVLIRWLATSLAIVFIPVVLPGVQVDGVPAAITAAAVLTTLNAVVRPALVFLTLPFTILSLGLFILIINAMLFEFPAYLVPGVRVSSFGYALAASLMVSGLSGILQLPWKGRVRMMNPMPPSMRPPSKKSHPKSTNDEQAIELDRDEDGKWG